MRENQPMNFAEELSRETRLGIRRKGDKVFRALETIPKWLRSKM
jgi:hypothetical protein